MGSGHQAGPTSQELNTPCACWKSPARMQASAHLLAYYPNQPKQPSLPHLLPPDARPLHKFFPLHGALFFTSGFTQKPLQDSLVPKSGVDTI